MNCISFKPRLAMGSACFLRAQFTKLASSDPTETKNSEYVQIKMLQLQLSTI